LFFSHESHELHELNLFPRSAKIEQSGFLLLTGVQKLSRAVFCTVEKKPDFLEKSGFCTGGVQKLSKAVFCF